MDRRQFIKNISYVVGSAYLTGCVSKTKLEQPKGRKLAFFTIENSIEKHSLGHLVGGNTSLVLLDVDSGDLSHHLLPMKFPHSLIQHPQLKNLAVITPRDQPKALVFDLKEGRVLKSLTLDGDQNFYGHGFFSKDGERLFLSGYGGANGKDGFLKEFDLNWRALGYLETFGAAPHDVKLIQDGNTVLIANNGWSGHSAYAEKSITSMAYVDLQKRKLIEKLEREPSFLAFQHFECNDRGDFVVACDYYGVSFSESDLKSLLAYREIAGPLSFLEIEPSMRRQLKGNTLSLRWDHSSQRVITTTPQGPVTIWDLNKMRASEQILNGYFPHGIEGNRKVFFVTTANKGIWKISTGEAGSPAQFEKLVLPYIQNISAHSTWIE